ncbi:phosphate ABC transporter permease [Halorhabdus rudnickae]|uniref:phosphate ABC transporter permease n=1 Tax=Halorhabdus rudnickae TaxID=1775544 RepID=UPI001083812E|nr:phosphate ABC transporter permease [Halorhabdus rudnickae]
MSGRVAPLGSIGIPTTVRGINITDVDRDVLATPATLTAVALLGVRLAINARVTAPLDLVGLQTALVPLATLVCAGSVLAIAVLDGEGYETVGLAFVGVFGVIGTIARPAYTPAVVAIIAGTALATGSQLNAEVDRRIGPSLVAFVLVCGLATSLIGTFGVEPATTRSIGSQLTLLGIAGTPIFLSRGHVDWLFGALGAGLLIALGVIAPFLLGATGLVAGGIVGASVPVMALAVGGLTTTASAALRRRHDGAVLGAGLLLFAGIPATIPRALALVLALTLLVGSRPGGVIDD